MAELTVFAVWALRCTDCGHLQAWAEWEPGVDGDGVCRDCRTGELRWRPELGGVLSLYGRSHDPEHGWLAPSSTLIRG